MKNLFLLLIYRVFAFAPPLFLFKALKQTANNHPKCVTLFTLYRECASALKDLFLFIPLKQTANKYLKRVVLLYMYILRVRLRTAYALCPRTARSRYRTNWDLCRFRPLEARGV